MAEVSTPSAITMATIDAGAEPSQSKSLPNQGINDKPEKPDEEAYKQQLEKATEALTAAQERTKEAQGRVAAARPGSKESPAVKQQQELRAQLNDIKTKQQSFKSGRIASQDKIKAQESQLKAKQQELKNAKSQIPYKSAEDIDREISRLEKEVDSGKMKLVDEKKNLAQISTLRKQRKAFGGFDELAAQIESIKKNIADAKKELDNPEYKQLSEDYTRIQQELDALRSEQGQAYKTLDTRREEHAEAKAKQDEAYARLKELKDDYYQKKRKYQEYQRQAARARDARRKEQQEQFVREKKRRDYERRLEEASVPAYTDEIKACDSLVRLLDPSAVKASAATGPGPLAAVAQRTVDSSGLTGTRLQKKDDDEAYFVGGPGKKSKKGKKSPKADLTSTPAASAESKSETRDFGKFFAPGVMEQFELVGLQPPSTQSELDATLAKIKEKRQFWEGDRDRKTKENIATAQKEIDDLETTDTKVNGSGTTDSVTDVTQAMDETSLEGPKAVEAEQQ